jgi:hypothetical protein
MARRPLRSGHALEDGRADPAAQAVSSTLTIHTPDYPLFPVVWPA